jgi:ribosomal protein S18 acetylase RimI-like enzyme
VQRAITRRTADDDSRAFRGVLADCGVADHVVRELTKDDIPTMRGVLGRAFADDPLMEHMFAGRPDIERRAGWLYGMFCTTHLHHGRCLTTAAAEGAALWTSPGRWKVGRGQQLRMLPGLVRLVGRRLPTLLGDFEMMERFHASMPEEHWYLSVLGTDPPCQGRGIGAALIEPVLETCDAEGLGAYLESSKESNLAYYSRFGFEVREELQFRNGPSIWPMWRDPR